MSAAIEPWARPGLRGPLAIGAAVYGAAIRARRFAYESGLLESTRLSRPVISVGNLAVGGTGKTPFTILLARRLEARGLRACVLSRGYRGSGGADPLLVASGGTILATPEVAGDEPILIGARTHAHVVVSRDRARGGAFAIERLRAEVLLLDDGFQHRALARDLDLVLLDAADPLGNGRLLPAGPLREPPGALRRADLVIHTRAPGQSARPEGARVLLSTRATAIRAPDGERRSPSSLAGKKVALLAAIARPERFAATVRALGAEVIHTRFLGDHAKLRAEDIAALPTADVHLTTEKDAARTGPSPLSVLEIALEIDEGEAELEAALARVLG